MYAIYDTQHNRYRTTKGWTWIVRSNDRESMEGLDNLLLFTGSEASRNSLPNGYEWRERRTIKWSDF